MFAWGREVPSEQGVSTTRRSCIESCLWRGFVPAGEPYYAFCSLFAEAIWRLYFVKRESDAQALQTTLYFSTRRITQTCVTTTPRMFFHKASVLETLFSRRPPMVHKTDTPIFALESMVLKRTLTDNNDLAI